MLILIGVEKLGEKGWAKVFKWDSDARGNIHQLTVGEKNRIYFIATKNSPGKPVRKRRYFNRCEIEDEKLDCKIISEADNRNSIISYFELPGGDIVFQEEMDMCIRRFSPYQIEARCIVSGPDLTRFYDVSPNGRFLVFERHTWEKEKIYNLHIMELDR